jgi:hypothetical protein
LDEPLLLLASGFGEFYHSALRGCHFVRQRECASELADLIVSAGTKCVAHSLKRTNVSHMPLRVSLAPLGHSVLLALRGAEQESSVAAHELPRESQIVGQSMERIRWITRKARVLAPRPFSKFLHVELMADGVRPKMVADEAQVFADVKL